ncbi:MAG TPA: hypothetical protein V6D50_00925 [Chroococcales cyanobacterium]
MKYLPKYWIFSSTVLVMLAPTLLSSLSSKAYLSQIQLTALQKLDETSTNSHRFILTRLQAAFSSQQQGEVLIYSEHPQTYVRKSGDIYCGAGEGDTEYSGNFVLTYKQHQMNLGQMTFNSNRHQVKLVKLNPTSGQDFIAISQYGACNYNELSLYSFDLQKQQLRQYQFHSPQGELLDKVSIAPGSVVKFDILPTREFITRFYNNVRGKLEVTQWRFNPNRGVFQTVRSWAESP